MAFRVRAQTPEEFQAWVAHMQTLAAQPAPPPRRPRAGARVRAKAPRFPRHTPPPPVDSAAAGEKLFTAKGCVACHSLVAVDAPKGMIGPNLANVGARSYIAAGTLKNTDENLAHWIRDPQGIKKGVLMPNLGVSETDAKALAAFLRAHQ